MQNYIFIYVFTIISFAFTSNDLIYHVPIKGTIDMGLPYYIERIIKKADTNNAIGIIFEIDTFGGRVDAATQIKDLIVNSKTTTIAFINKRAISAGALIALSCDSIFMAMGSTIGAATAVSIDGEKASEKIISYMREEMASTAEANNRSRDIASGMVDEELSLEFIVNSNGDTLTNKEIEGFKSGKLITLSTLLALRTEIADKEVNNIKEIINYMGWENENFFTTKESWSEILVRFLTNPTVAPLFMSLGMVGLFFEIKSPGFGIPGLLGLICLGLFFGSHLLVGLADFTELIILFVGIGLILLELILIPGFGFFGIVGIIACFYSLFKMLLGDYPVNNDYFYAYVGISIGILSGFISMSILYKILPKTELYKKLIPYTPQKSNAGYTVSKGYEKLIGFNGITVTDLRPTGRISIDGNFYQAMSYGDYIEKDKEIIIDAVDENLLLVKKLKT